jgi:putative protein-disulfide isomerase
MTLKTLHYIMDPQCGWCYAAAPLIDALTELTAVNIKLHGGGLFSGANKRQLSAGFHQQIITMDKKITGLTGQVFSSTYYSQVLEDQQRVVDSDTPIAALLAAQSLGVDPVLMLHQMQITQFVEGRSQSDISNLTAIVNELGVDSAAFLNAFTLINGEKTAQHINNSRNMLHLVGGNGFPTLTFEHADGAFTKLEHSSYYGQPKQWIAYVVRVLKTID